MIVIDGFIDSYLELKEYSRHCEFSAIKNVVDGVIYPDICAEIPDDIRAEILDSLKEVTGRTPMNPTMFMRMSKNDCYCPHPIHHDLSMGSLSLMLYMSDEGGTAFVRHDDTGITYAPKSRDITDMIRGEATKLDSWTVYDGADMKQNRALIFDAGIFHMAQPVGGYGTTQEDARLVLTCFFS